MGLAECLERDRDPLGSIPGIQPLGWYLLSAGRPSANPGDLLHGDDFPRILHSLTPFFDWILLDSPPVTPLADTLGMARHADATLLVVRAGKTPRDAVETALSALGSARVAAVILNGVPGLQRLYYKYSPIIVITARASAPAASHR